MTISKETLNQLYNQGIINYVPSEIYNAQLNMPANYENPYMHIKAQAMMGSRYGQYAKYGNIGGPTYLDSAMRGELYNYNDYDNYTPSKNIINMMYSDEDQEIFRSVVNTGKKAKKSYSEASPIVKGLSALGLVIFSLFALSKGKKNVVKK